MVKTSEIFLCSFLIRGFGRLIPIEDLLETKRYFLSDIDDLWTVSREYFAGKNNFGISLKI